jgi:hypothetical protein
MLADVLGLRDRRALRAANAAAGHCKLVTFVPEAHVERISAALFAAGAGHIGDYTQCSFRTTGTGTFFGREGTNPAVGHSGRLEQVQELRLETVVPHDRVGAVVNALHSAHPYEQPAFDLVPLAAPPGSRGQGRVGSIEPAIDRGELIARIKRDLNVHQVLVAGPTEGSVQCAACCAGSCGDLLDDALRQSAQMYLTGEVRHHDALRAASAGMTVVCVLHSNSERAVLRHVAERLSRELPELAVHVSRVDKDPFSIV